MNTNSKPLVALSLSVAVSAVMLCQNAQAQLNISGTAGLADTLGDQAPSPEALTVKWSVVQAGPVYTYSYDVYNPPGDVNLDTHQPERIDDFLVDFDTTNPNAYIANSLAGLPPLLESMDVGDTVAGGGGATWAFEQGLAIAPGASSGWLSFQSYLPPSIGEATANDHTPPSPWNSLTGNGDPIPVPGNGNYPSAPDSTSTMTLLGGMILLLPFGSAFRKRN